MTSVELVPWMPLIVTALTAVAGLIAYAANKSIDRKHALIEMRRTAYRNYLRAFMAMSDSPERLEDVRREYYQSEVELLIIGSDQVIKKVGKLSGFYTDTNDDRFNRDVLKVRQLVADVCRAMRADCFEKSSLSLDEIQALVPIA